jgi:hypothetical protein
MKTSRLIFARFLGILALAATPAVVLAQPTPVEQGNPPSDVQGAGRIEIDTAVFGGGGIIIPSAVASDRRSRSYVVSGAVTANVNKWFGLEGEIGWVMGHHQAHELYGVVPIGPEAPNMLLWSGNVLYNPLRSNRPLIPYLTGGLGALTTFEVAPGSSFGLAGDRTYLTASAGTGLRWYPIPHWGVRGDYRLLHVRNDSGEAAPGQRVVRYAHRIYAALVLTF